MVDESPQVQRAARTQEGIDRSLEVAQRRKANSPLGGALRAGIETLSGLSMDDVRVHYNSPKPAQLQALAYTQGTEIHVGPGQERHLPHEAWHVVQQKQGRVQATLQVKGLGINDEAGLEREADVMGERARRLGGEQEAVSWAEAQGAPVQRSAAVVQRAQPIHGTAGNDFESYILGFLGPYMVANGLGMPPAHGAPAAAIAGVATWLPALNAARLLDHRHHRVPASVNLFTGAAIPATTLNPVAGGAAPPGLAAVQLQEMQRIHAFLQAVTGAAGAGAGVDAAGRSLSVIHWGGLHHGFGTKVEAVLLPGGQQGGSQPSILASTAWNNLTHRKKADGTTLYAQGHLLHDDMGGPGLDYNLTPLTNATGGDFGANNANLAHRQAVEGPVLDAYRDMHGVGVSGRNITQVNYAVAGNFTRPARPETAYMQAIANAYLAEINRLKALPVAGGGTGGAPPTHAQVMPGLAAQVLALNAAAVPHINDAIASLALVFAPAVINATFAALVWPALNLNATIWHTEDQVVPLELLLQYGWTENGVAKPLRSRRIPVELPDSLRALIA